MNGVPLPTHQDDPRLQGWYHTIELGGGLVSRAIYDHRSVVDRYGLPPSLVGKTALDVGTFDGFWAFELERRGADRVVAIDVENIGAFDWLPAAKKALGARVSEESHFPLAQVMRGSRVKREICSVYDLSPERVGTFDVVFCGDVLLHLWNPLKALVNIRAVTRESAHIQTTIDAGLEAAYPDVPVLRFGQRGFEATPGEQCTYWIFNSAALSQMMEYAGFEVREPQGTFQIPGGPLSTCVVGRV